MLLILVCLLGFVLAARARWLLAVYRDLGRHPLVEGLLLGWLVALAGGVIMVVAGDATRAIGLWLIVLGSGVFLAAIALTDVVLTDAETRVGRRVGGPRDATWWRAR